MARFSQFVFSYRLLSGTKGRRITFQHIVFLLIKEWRKIMSFVILLILIIWKKKKISLRTL